MRKLEVFFDYNCPYCLRGHEYLVELLPQYPQLEVDWHPTEAHPRPEVHGLHSDLLARGMYVAQALHADLMEYHRRMYQAARVDRLEIEDLQVVAGAVEGLVDGGAFQKALLDGAYIAELTENNRLAWSEYAFEAVPSYRMNGEFLRSIGKVGVTKEQLAAFIQRNMG